MPDSSTRFIGERGWTEGGGNKCKRWREMIGMRWRLIEEEVRKRVEVGEREKRGGRHFLLHLLLLSFHLKFFSFHLQSSFDVHSFFILVFSTISTVSYLLCFSAFESGSHAFLSPPPPHRCVIREKVHGIFPQFNRTNPNPHHPHALVFCLSLDSLCLMSEGESLEENHPYSTTKYSGCLLELYATRCSVNIDCVLLWQHNN